MGIIRYAAGLTPAPEDLRAVAIWMKEQGLENQDRLDGRLDQRDQERIVAALVYLDASGAPDLDTFAEAYRGAWTDRGEWAKDWTGEMAPIASLPEWVRIDWEGTAEELLEDDFVAYAVGDDYFVFYAGC